MTIKLSLDVLPADNAQHRHTKSSRSFTRRSFLKTAALAGAAPLILRSSLWGQNSTPSKQFTLGFIGLASKATDCWEIACPDVMFVYWA